MHKRHFNEKRVKEEHARWGRLQYFKEESLSVTSEICTTGFSALSFQTFLPQTFKIKMEARQAAMLHCIVFWVHIRYWNPINLSLSVEFFVDCSPPERLAQLLKIPQTAFAFCLCVSHEVHFCDLPSWCVDSPCDRVPGAHTELITGLWWKY